MWMLIPSLVTRPVDPVFVGGSRALDSVKRRGGRSGATQNFKRSRSESRDGRFADRRNFINLIQMSVTARHACIHADLPRLDSSAKIEDFEIARDFVESRGEVRADFLARFKLKHVMREPLGLSGRHP
jgi:hypothetical protein